MTGLEKDLLAMRVKLHLHRKNATSFTEEVLINNVIHAVGKALDVLNGKSSLLQGPKEETTDGED